MTGRLTVVPFLAVLALSGRAMAQVSVGGDFQVPAQNAYQHLSSPTIGFTGDLFLTWNADDRQGLAAVFAQHYAPDGQLVGTPFRTGTLTAGDGGGRTATLANGGFVVVSGGAAPTRGIWARRFTAAGAALGAEFQVAQFSGFSYGNVAVAADAGGGFVVAWDAPDGGVHGVFARRYDRASEPIGSEFQVNTYTTGFQGAVGVAVAGTGASMFTWVSEAPQDGSGYGVYARRYDPSGRPLGDEFRVNSYTTGDQSWPTLAMDAQGDAVVTWISVGQDGSEGGSFGRLYDPAGAPRGGEFQVNVFTNGNQTFPSVDMDESGNFVVAWSSTLSVGQITGRRFDANGAPRSGEFVIGHPPFQGQGEPWLDSDRRGNFAVSWNSASFLVFGHRFGWIFPAQMHVDPAAGTTSDGNHVFEPCERVPLQTGWRNRSAGTQPLTGAASSFTGPPGATYVLRDASADYGAVPVGAVGLCATGGDCYEVEVPCPASRPATHWDAQLSEKLAPDVQGQTAIWRVHLGDSFADVPRASPYYLWVEALLHNNVTGGCTATTYCGGDPTTREQMAVFLVSGRAGPYYAPPACQAPVFGDVPASSPYCRWIEELARFGVTAGCGSGNYCPGAKVSRQEMAVFVLRTAEPGFVPPACGTPVFSDVPASSPYCRWIEELVRRGVVTGCGGGRFCPNDAVTREQMAVFIVLTFGLGIYDP